MSSSSMPVELRLKFGPVVGLHDVDAKRQAPTHFVDEADRGALVARVVDLQDPNPRAIINGRELIQSLARARNPLEELHIQLESMARERFLITLPSLPVWLMLLIGREPVHPVLAQNAVHRRARHRDLVEPLQIVGDLASPEMVGLPQI